MTTDCVNVRLISWSKPNELLPELAGKSLKELIAYCARVSNPENQMNDKTADGLVNYLIKHRHWSPFEMVSACLEIEAPRDISRQILRHRSGSFQEFSQRYADPKAMATTYVIREARLQDTKNRQNSIETDDAQLIASWESYQRQVIQAADDAYQWAIENGIAKECARVVLPEGNTMSRMYMNATVRTWLHYIDLRAANGTQKEHMEVARKCAAAIAEVFAHEKIMEWIDE